MSVIYIMTREEYKAKKRQSHKPQSNDFLKSAFNGAFYQLGKLLMGWAWGLILGLIQMVRDFFS